MVDENEDGVDKVRMICSFMIGKHSHVVCAARLRYTASSFIISLKRCTFLSCTLNYCPGFGTFSVECGSSTGSLFP